MFGTLLFEMAARLIETVVETTDIILPLKLAAGTFLASLFTLPNLRSC